MTRSPLDRFRTLYGPPDAARDEALRDVAARYAVSVTDHVGAVMENADDPVGRQYLPQASELRSSPDEMTDPIGDKAHSPVPGIVHRYPDRVLLMPVQVCAVYCRFCFRREHVGPGQERLTPAQLDAALDYIRAHPGIWEVILSGGDALVLSPRRLKSIMGALHDIPHVRVIRIHTRVPVADPRRVTAALCDVLDTEKPVYICIHVNHAREITAEAERAFRDLRRAGCVLLSQSVLLRGVNDTTETLESLFRRLVELRVKPYYLHHPDFAPGTAHFRLGLEEGQAIVGALRGRLSGVAIPTYMLDIPGGFGKVPVGPSHVCLAAPGRPGRIVLTDPSGRAHLYPPAGTTGQTNDETSEKANGKTNEKDGGNK